MRSIRSTLAVVATLSAILASPQAVRAADLVVKDAFARATTGTSPGAAYLVIEAGPQPDRLIAAASPRAARVELHTMTMQDNVMRMRELNAIEIPANATTKLAPGGLHLMLMGLTAPLRPGETVPITLTFEKAGPRQVEVKVAAPGGATAPGGTAAPAAHQHQ